MTDLITPVQIPQPLFEITYHSKLFFTGSCFSEYIGNKMKELRFLVCHNPFGVIYNPLSIATNLQLLLEKEVFTEDDLRFYNELWFSFNHYTFFSHPDKQICLDKINSSFSIAKKFINESDFIFITLGTSWVYRLKETGEVVANCHKQPAALFDRSFLTVELSFEALKLCIERIRKTNSAITFIFTVSPIRHWKDGAINNKRSKAALLLAIAKLQEWDNSIYYFPAYEIFMDELRDYRFYASDMLHPSERAQNYIWNKFIDNFISNEHKEILRNVEKIMASIKHKPYFPSTQSYQKFRSSVINKIVDISQKYTFLDLSDILRNFDTNV